MNEMRSNGTTLLYVSHSMNSVLNICDSALWLDKGVVKGKGKAKSVVNEYLNYLKTDKFK